MRQDLTQRRGYSGVLFLLALAMGLAIAWMDARPHWNDTGVTVGCLVLSAGLFGVLGPRRPWLLGLAIGAWVPLYLITGRVATHTMTMGTLSYLAILLFPMAAVYAGAGLRRLFAPA